METIPLFGMSEPFSAVSHLSAAVGFSIATVFLLIRARGNVLRMLSLALYSTCVIYLFSMSGVYHILEPGTTARDVFQRLDHSAIWATIAGAFTPLHIILFRKWWRSGILLLIWTTAITGLVLEVIFLHEIPEFVSLSFYLGLGWMGLLSGWKFLQCYKEQSFKLIALGGVTFSIGATMEFMRVPVLIPGYVGPHEIFHIFVVLGIFFHWRFMYLIADFAISDKLTLNVKIRPDSHIFVTAVTEDIRFEADSKDEIYKLLNVWIAKKYPAYTRPSAIKLKYVTEEFVDPTSSTRVALTPEHFHGPLKSSKKD